MPMSNEQIFIQNQSLSSSVIPKKPKNLPSEPSKLSSINIIAKKRPPPLNIGYNEIGVDAKRTVLYRNFHEISEKVYLVEISRNKTKIFMILFENFETPTKFIGDVL